MPHLFFLVFIISFAVMTGAFLLGLLYYQKETALWKFKGCLFLGFILFLFLSSGIRFYFSEIAGVEDNPLRQFLQVLYVIGYSLLIYYLPATINYMLRRPWSRGRLFWILFASVSYFIAGIIAMIKGLSPTWNLPLGFIFFMAFGFVVIDALRSLPLIRDKRGRLTVTLLFSGTFIFLPLLLVVRMTQALFYPEMDYEMLLFPLQIFYFLWLALVIIPFLMNRILISDTIPLPLSEKPQSFFEEKGITTREREIILFLEKGLTYKEIGRELFISANTVSNHVASIYKKTGQRSRVEMLNSLRSEA